MRKKLWVAVAALSIAAALSACGGKNGKTEESSAAAKSTEAATEKADEKAEAKSTESGKEMEGKLVLETGAYPESTQHLKTGEKPESPTVTWAQGASGNVLVSIAKAQGYFDEVGITVNEIPLDENQIQAVSTGQVDIASNTGTWAPLKNIVAGDDIAIIGGNMLTGCMPIIAKEGAEWKGAESLLGKKFGESVASYATLNGLVKEGHDVTKEITFVDGMADADKIQAILKGELDYATVGTGRMYQVLNTKGIQIVSYCSDITPNYSCCRMIARNSWVQKNPTTVKLLNEALIRAQAYFQKHKQETVDLMAKQLNANKEYVEAYLLNEHYRINPDTLKNTVFDNYRYMMAVHGVDNVDKTVKLEDRIYNELYKEALDEAQKKWGSEDPSFYEEAQKFYTEHNTNQ